MKKADIIRTVRRPRPGVGDEYVAYPPETPPDHDARRVDRCANRKSRGAVDDCPNDAPRGHSYCSESCVAEAVVRMERQFIGGSLERHWYDIEFNQKPWDRDPISGTRFPRENSPDGPGYT